MRAGDEEVLLNVGTQRGRVNANKKNAVNGEGRRPLKFKLNNFAICGFGHSAKAERYKGV